MPSNKKSAQLKYFKPAITVALVALLILGLRVGHQALLAREDVQTRKAATVLDNTIIKHIDKYKSVPLDLSIMDVKNPPKNIHYKIIDGNHYRICAVFQRANNPSVSKFRQFINLFHTDKKPMLADELDKSVYYGVASFDDFHLAGPDCQNIWYYKFWPKQ